MDFAADVLLVLGTFLAAGYCIILGRRLRSFTSAEGGIGAAIAALSTQVSDLTQTLDRAQAAARTSGAALRDTTDRAEAAARQLELLIASLHDLPQDGSAAASPTATDPQGSEPETRFVRSARRGARGAGRL